MIDIVCVKCGTEYSDEYVRILKASIDRNTTIPHRFICLSDTEIDGIETKRLSRGIGKPWIRIDGWWNKLQLFNPSFQLAERVIYFDLDTVITGNLDFFLEYNGDFCGIENLGVANRFEQHWLYKNVFQSGVMAWKNDWPIFIWKTFEEHHKEIMKKVRGDGEFLHMLFKQLNIKPDLFQNLWPNKLKSYKYQAYEGGIGEASIICFHGEPRPHQAINETTYPWGIEFIPSPWVKTYWRL